MSGANKLGQYLLEAGESDADSRREKEREGQRKPKELAVFKWG